MGATIFCTFEQRDLADLAMGKVRLIPGVKTIHYIIDHAAHQRLRGGTNRADGGMSYGVLGSSGGYGMLGFSGQNNAVGVPPLPATAKITCSDKARKSVVSTLINLHAYNIITTP